MDDRAPEHSGDEPGFDLGPAPGTKAAEPYRVLARKYRPQDFTGLIGQEALVRTLSNAFQRGRIAHGFMLTGVRGVGKTTTARIIARALNCIGPDGTGTRPTIAPCGVCEHCVAIAESRSVDVLEMDAASRTGIDDIREIIEGARYAPVSARAKVYIIDEVHMLSKAAFNGLLKTLEEPPPHVTFIFATTEIRKVPVTVLSRCQRFDLRRVEAAELAAHLALICEKEGVAAEAAALGLIARAAEGSVRDALSLLDQAIAHAEGAGAAAAVRETETRTMLGLADRARVIDLFEHAMAGRAADALQELRAQYELGAEPAVVLQDLLEFTHWLTRLKHAPQAGDDPTLPEEDRVRGAAMAESLPVPVLTRAWQMLLKGLAEVREAPQPIAAAEMVLIRLAYAADLPPPERLMRTLQDHAAGRPTPPPAQAGRSAPPGAPRARAAMGEPQAPPPPAAQAETHPAPAGEPDEARPRFARLEEIAAHAGSAREFRLRFELEHNVHLVRFEQGRIEFRPGAQASADLAGSLAAKLKDWTGRRWTVSISNAPGAPTIAAERAARELDAIMRASETPAVRAVLDRFPGARIVAVRGIGSADEDGGVAAPIDDPDGAEN